MPLGNGQSSHLEINRVEMTCLAHAGQAADTFGIIGIFIKFDPHGTHLVACLTLGTALGIMAQFYKLHSPEKGVKGPQGTGSSAEGTTDRHTPDQENGHNCQLVIKKKADSIAEFRLQNEHGYTCLKGACRTYIFTEPWLTETEFVNRKQRQQYHKKEQKKILRVFQPIGNAEFAGWDLMYQLLQKTERTGPAADKSANRGGQQAHAPHHVEPEKILPVADSYPDTCQQLLQRANRTECGRGWT
jgi:hypothetical protein